MGPLIVYVIMQWRNMGWVASSSKNADTCVPNLNMFVFGRVLNLPNTNMLVLTSLS